MGICINSMGLYGMNAYPVQVEADTLRALPSFDIVGLPDASVKESRDRVRIAMKNCGYEFPATKITVNLAPADIKKSGPLYDVPILLAMLCITGQLACGDLSDSVFLGELSLDGSVRPVNGVLPMAVAARKSGAASLFVPQENAAEAALVSGRRLRHRKCQPADCPSSRPPAFNPNPAGSRIRRKCGLLFGFRRRQRADCRQARA